jgi:NAD(P)-dependent dehydrogenase (short-subunit alcohol dehydrogenase family)
MIEHGLDGRVALVTGGTSGIGRSCVERLRAEGMTVIFTGRSEERGLVAQTSDLPCCDARDRASTWRSPRPSASAARDSSRTRHLMAGRSGRRRRDAFRELLEVNRRRCFARAGVPPMREQAAARWSITSTPHSRRPRHRCVLRHEWSSLSPALRRRGRAHGIRADASARATSSGVQSTPTGFESHAESPEGWVLPPSGRFGTGEDVAGLVAWLACDESAHMNGATLRLDGAAGAAMRVVTR